VTCGSYTEARRLSTGLIRNRLAACVNILDVRSVYRWEGKLHDDTERLLVIKSTPSSFKEIESYIKANHSYDCPEIVAMESSKVSKEYLQWVISACNQGER
jgi:periplasmic divalent cation tolerance protein